MIPQKETVQSKSENSSLGLIYIYEWCNTINAL